MVVRDRAHGMRRVSWAVVLVAALVHGPQTRELGLYWDDAVQLMQGFQAAGDDVLAFVFTDTAASLRSERPLAYLPFTMTRAVFALGLTPVHATIVVLLALNALLVARLVWALLPHPWFAFAAATIFLVHPLAPLQSLWPATVHYHVACLLVLLTLLVVVRHSTVPARAWIIVAGLVYAASMLTHEAFALIPPAFALVQLFMVHGTHANGSAGEHDRWSASRATLVCLVVFIALFGLFALWRAIVLPRYGVQLYSFPTTNLTTLVLSRALTSGVMAVFPWPAFFYVVRSAEPARWLLVAVVVAVIAGVLSFVLLRSNPLPGIHRGNLWSAAPGAAAGLGVLVAGVIALSASPVGVWVTFGATYGPRGNFVVVPGIAMAAPFLFVLLVGSVRARPLASTLIGLVCLFAIGFIGLPGQPAIVTHRSSVPVWFGRYSSAYGLIVAGYVAAVLVLAGTVAMLACRALGVAASRGGWLSWRPHSAHVLTVVLAGVTLCGSLVHSVAKQEFAEQWRRQKTMLAALQRVVPGVAANTVVVFDDERAQERRAPYVERDELSSYLLALYDDWSVIGTTTRDLVFHKDGVDVPGLWFPPGVKGPVVRDAIMPIGRVPYDRVLLLAFDGRDLRLVPELTVTTVAGERVVLVNNLDRIRPDRRVRTRTWDHVSR